MSVPPPPEGQGPIDPRGAFSPPPPPTGAAPPQPPPGWRAPSPPPPPGYPPAMYPMMMPPPPPPPRHRTFARGIFMTLATTIFGLSLALNAYLLLFSGLIGTQSSRQNTLIEGDATQRVAVIPVKGMILDDLVERFDRFARLAERDVNVKAIVIEVDSPGGSVTASDQIHQRIKQLKAAKNVPIIVSTGALATSGGYYIACAADYIFAQPTTMTGNIGVLLPRFNVHKLFDKWGIEETTIQSTGADFKNAGSMFKPEKPAETAYIQGIADEAFRQFKKVVVDGRGDKLNGSIDAIADGKVFMAGKAKDLGLVDELGYPEDAYKHAAQKAGLSNMSVVRYQSPPTLMDLLGSESTLPVDSNNRSVTINGVNVNLDASSLLELSTPRLMYLWRGE